MQQPNMRRAVSRFFRDSELLDFIVLRPLDHIRSNWDITWDPDAEMYSPEDNSFAALLNALVEELADVEPPARYHDNEDRLAEYVVERLRWPIYKNARGYWIGEEYAAILQQGGFADVDEAELLFAAAGRIRAAIRRGQLHFDDMESGHRHMLGAVLSVILYHRA